MSRQNTRLHSCQSIIVFHNKCNYKSSCDIFVAFLEINPLLPDPLGLEVVVPIRISSMCQMDLFKNYS